MKNSRKSISKNTVQCVYYSLHKQLNQFICVYVWCLHLFSLSLSLDDATVATYGDTEKKKKTPLEVELNINTQ